MKMYVIESDHKETFQRLVNEFLNNNKNAHLREPHTNISKDGIIIYTAFLTK